MRQKITVVGAGNVGATLAQRLAERDYADVVLVDIVEGMPQGKALDIMESGPILGFDSLVTGTNSYEETKGSSIVIITSGLPRKPGMSRDDLVLANAKIVTSVVRSVATHSPNAILIVVSNPVDAMAQLALRVSGFPRERVLGMGGVLDTGRFATFLAEAAHTSVHDVSAYVLGGHGDSMVPIVGMTSIAGIPVEQVLPKEKVAEIVQRARNGGAEIVNLLKTGSAYYAPSAASLQMVDAIVLDQKRVLPATVYLDGEYGISGVYTGVPVRLGSKGLEAVVTVPLTSEESAAVRKSADAVREVVAVIDAKKNDIDPTLPRLLTESVATA